jgi:hypothetical protein
MSFDLFDKKIKEAADNHHPAYDEKAWDKMEDLLDKHMPQKKDRRRFIFFLLLFLLLGGGSAYLLIDKPWKTNNTIATTEKKADQNISNPVIENKSQQTVSQPNITATDNNNNEQVSNKNDKSSLTQNIISQPKTLTTSEQEIDIKIKKPRVERSIVKNNDRSKQTESSKSITVTPNNKNNSYITITSSKNDQSSTVLNNNVVTNNDNTPVKPVIDNPSNKNEENKIVPDKAVVNNNVADVSKKDEVDKNEQQAKKKTGKNKTNGFFAFSLSGGPDVSKAGSSDLSKVDWSYGAGISYTLKKFTLRSGFYIAQKIYSADAKDYKLEYTLPPNIKLLNVDANCKVYEIPLSLAYNFASGKNSNWYASLGFSSYLMKSEKYQNWYKNTTTNTTYPRSFQYSSKNNHYFSVLDLSAGYTYKINKTFSLSAEPYLKLPLQGIGEGKVHLNSAGVLFSLGIKPFKAKSK